MVASRIDMFIISNNICSEVTKTDIEYGYRSDHALLELVIRVSEHRRGPGIWRLNTQVLDEVDYKVGILKLITKLCETHGPSSPDTLWREIKVQCADFSKTYCKNRVKKSKKKMEELRETENWLVNDVAVTGDPNAKEALLQVRSQLSVYGQARTESAIFRSRAEYVKEGEKNTRYFFGLERRRYLLKNSQSIINDKGKEIRDPRGVLNEQFKFYKGLYSKDRKVNFNLTRGPAEPVLSEEDKEKLDEDITTAELFDAVMTLKKGKVCGGDGLPLEFYRTFFDVLKGPLLRMYKYAYINGVLPTSTRRGIISLLQKPNKNPKYIANYRPLALLSYDYKILAKAMDNRLRTVLHKLISDDQTGFMAGRHITTNIRKTLDVVEYCKRSNKAAVILTVDMEKCFDRIDFTAISGALKYFNFGEKF